MSVEVLLWWITKPSNKLNWVTAGSILNDTTDTSKEIWSNKLQRLHKLTHETNESIWSLNLLSHRSLFLCVTHAYLPMHIYHSFPKQKLSNNTLKCWCNIGVTLGQQWQVECEVIKKRPITIYTKFINVLTESTW